MAHPVRLSRRSLLGGLGAAALLAACGGTGTDPQTGATTPTAAGTGKTPVPGGGELNVQVLWPELILGADRFLQFVVLDPEQAPVLGQDVTVTLRNREGDATIGPLEARFFPDERIPPQGIYDVVVTVETAGVYDVEVETADGRRGVGFVQAMPPEDSRVLAHGQVVPVVDTPTVEDQQDLEQLCTREPDCSMHDRSLQDVHGQGNPIVLTIATPAFCTSALCGPVVDDVETVKQDLDRDDVVFLHVEPFKDAGNTPTDIVNEFQLPTEPWTFVLDGAGAIVERFPGPVVPEVLRDVLART